MHELALTQYVVDAVVDKLGDAPVGRVRLEIGQRPAVPVDAIRFCFDLVTDGTTLQGASLEIDEPPGLASCRSCGQEIQFDSPTLLCPCGSANVDVRSGQELKILSVE